MIVQQFSSGLGNQMFQYVFFRKLKKMFPEVRIRADLSWFEWHDVHQGYELDRLFGLKLPKASPGEVLLTSGQLPHNFFCGRYINRVLRIFDSGYMKSHIVDELPADRLAGLDTSRQLYLTGFYISEKYYREDLEEIRKVFAFPKDELASSSVMIHHIESTESVSIHVRRGDYLDPVYESRFNVLTEDYYRQAVERMREIFDDPHFFIFSDDKDFAADAFSWIASDRRTVVTGNTGVDSWKDMYLMSICRGNILANSTFSTWGALLNTNAKVIYPKAYMAGLESEVKTLEGWERL